MKKRRRTKNATRGRPASLYLPNPAFDSRAKRKLLKKWGGKP